MNVVFKLAVIVMGNVCLFFLQELINSLLLEKEMLENVKWVYILFKYEKRNMKFWLYLIISDIERRLNIY